MNDPKRFAAALLFLVALLGCQSGGLAQPAGSASSSSGPMRVYVGTYTGKDSKGVYVMDLDPKTGSLTEPKLAAEVKSPSFLALHPAGKYLYAVSEVDSFDGKKTGGVASFEMREDGTLQALNQQPSGGTGPCHLEVDVAGRCVVVANYGSGSVSVLPLDPPSGRLKPSTQTVQHEGSSVDKRRQEGPHAHCANLFGNFAAVADLGLDKTFIYQLDPATSSLKLRATADAPPGSGPRHVARHRGRNDWGKWMYVNNEMTSTVSVFPFMDVPPREVQNISTLPEALPAGFDKSKNSTAEIAVHPSGKFLYVSNRGHDSIAIFKVDRESGKLTAAGHQSTGGKTPRNFGIEPSGRFLLAANQASGNVVVFRIDPETGALTPTGATAAVPTPVCVVFAER